MVIGCIGVCGNMKCILSLVGSVSCGVIGVKLLLELFNLCN